MSRPVIMTVHDGALAAVERELRKRYGEDYEVLCHASTAEARPKLEEITASGGQVAVLLADMSMGEMANSRITAAEFAPVLSRTQEPRPEPGRGGQASSGSV